MIEPSGVTLSGVAQAGVQALVVEESAAGPVQERDEAGPYAVFADCPAREVRVTIRQQVVGAGLGAVAVGQMVEVVATLSPGGADAGARTLSFGGCVLEVRYDLAGKVPTRLLTLAAVSDDGAAHPVTVS